MIADQEWPYFSFLPLCVSHIWPSLSLFFHCICVSVSYQISLCCPFLCICVSLILTFTFSMYHSSWNMIKIPFTLELKSIIFVLKELLSPTSVYLFLSLSLCPSLFLSFSALVCLSHCFFVSLIPLCLYFSSLVCLPLYFSLSLLLYVYLSVSMSPCLSISLSLSLTLSVSLSPHHPSQPFIHPTLYPSPLFV